MPQPIKYGRWVHELSFSIYCALLIVTDETFKESSILLRWGYPQLYQLLLYLHHHARLVPGRNLLFIALWWVLAVAFFGFLRLLGRIGLMRTLICHVSGLVTVAGFPLVWLDVGKVTSLPLVTARWLLFEVVVIAACVFLYLYRDRPTNAALSIPVLAFHFGFWGWITWSACRFGDPSIYLLFGIGTTLAWGSYVELPAESHAPAKTDVAQ